jgi:hypothetical protein
MAVKRRMIHGKFLSMFSKVVIGLPRNERIENGAKDVEDQHDYGDEAKDAHSASSGPSSSTRTMVPLSMEYPQVLIPGGGV